MKKILLKSSLALFVFFTSNIMSQTYEFATDLEGWELRTGTTEFDAVTGNLKFFRNGKTAGGFNAPEDGTANAIDRNNRFVRITLKNASGLNKIQIRFDQDPGGNITLAERDDIITDASNFIAYDFPEITAVEWTGGNTGRIFMTLSSSDGMGDLSEPGVQISKIEFASVSLSSKKIKKDSILLNFDSASESIIIDSAQKGSGVKIYNLIGSLLKTVTLSENLSIDISDLSSGVYLLAVNDANGGIASGKFIIE